MNTSRIAGLLIGLFIASSSWRLCAAQKKAPNEAQKKSPDCQYWIDFYKSAKPPRYRVLQMEDITVDERQYWQGPEWDAATLGPRIKFPGCVVADFNGDGIQDFALLLWLKTGPPAYPQQIKGNIPIKREWYTPIKLKLIVMMAQKDGTFRQLDVPNAEWDSYLPSEENLVAFDFSVAEAVLFWC